MTHDELIEAVARAIDEASKNARLGQDWQWFIPEARAAIRVIAPAVLDQAIVTTGGSLNTVDAVDRIRALKPEYEA